MYPGQPKREMNDISIILFTAGSTKNPACRYTEYNTMIAVSISIHVILLRLLYNTRTIQG